MHTDNSPWEDIAAGLARQLEEARGSAELERMAIARALAAYARARAAHHEPPFEHALHFFAVDGLAPGCAVTPAFARVTGDDAAFDRWLELLTTLPQRLDQLDFMGSVRPPSNEPS